MIEIIHYKDVNDNPAYGIDLGWVPISSDLYRIIRKYHAGESSPNYPVPAHISLLNLVAAYPIGAKEDFFDIGNAGLKLLA